jgi:hypothetical protein
MSYARTLFGATQGIPLPIYGNLSEEDERNAADLEAWLKTPISESIRNEMHAIADFLKSKVPEFVQVQPESPLPWIE